MANKYMKRCSTSLGKCKLEPQHNAVRTCVLSHFSRVQLFATLWTIALQGPLSMGFSRPEHWSGFPCPPPRDLLDPGIQPVSPVTPALQADYLPLSHHASPVQCHRIQIRTAQL